jgi:hypothetical protein
LSKFMFLGIVISSRISFTPLPVSNISFGKSVQRQCHVILKFLFL